MKGSAKWTEILSFFISLKSFLIPLLINKKKIDKDEKKSLKYKLSSHDH